MNQANNIKYWMSKKTHLLFEYCLTIDKWTRQTVHETATDIPTKRNRGKHESWHTSTKRLKDKETKRQIYQKKKIPKGQKTKRLKAKKTKRQRDQNTKIAKEKETKDQNAKIHKEKETKWDKKTEEKKQ